MELTERERRGGAAGLGGRGGCSGEAGKAPGGRWVVRQPGPNPHSPLPLRVELSEPSPPPGARDTVSSAAVPVGIETTRMSTLGLLCARHFTKYFMSLNSLTFHRSPVGRYNYHLHFTDEELEAQRG